MEGGWTEHATPVGELTIGASPAGALTLVRFPGPGWSPGGLRRRPLPTVTEQLDAYFAGELRAFELELELRGSRFQLAVWNRLREIPYGETLGYGELAATIDAADFPAATEPHQRARAVGAEVGRTPTPIVVPCHRVVGADGSLVGYGGGLERKRALLALESSQLALL